MFDRRIGVLIGVSEYDKSFWPPLPYVRGDIEGPDGLASVLINDLGACSFAKSDVHIRLNKYTHRQNMTFLREVTLNPSLSRNTLICLYFSGHGYIDSEVGDIPCLIMQNTSAEDPASQGITFKWIRDEIISKTNATILLVIDCCFSGQIISKFDWSKEIMGDHFAIFTSSAKDQDSFASGDGTQSFFTKRFIEALRGKGIAQRNGLVDTDSVYEYMGNTISEADQHPQFLRPPHAFLLSIPQRPIIAAPRPSFDERVLGEYIERKREVSNSDPMLTSDTLFVRGRVDVIATRGIPSEAVQDLQDYEVETKSDVPALDSLLKWVQESREVFAFVLGDTGLGKTTLLRRVFYELCEKHLKGEFAQYPIFLDLRMYSDVRLQNPIKLHRGTRDEESSRRFRAVLIDWLQNVEGIPILWSEFIHLIEAGKFILILDGLDEMCLNGKPETVSLSLNMLSALCRENSKLILSCRTHFFRSENEMLSAFNRANLMAGGNSRFNLLHFGEHQIEQFLDWHLDQEGKDRWKELKNSGTLGIEQLSRRPFLLSILAHHLQEKAQTSPTLIFEELLNGWLNRDRWRFEQFLEDFAEAIERDLQGLSTAIPLRKSLPSRESEWRESETGVSIERTWPEEVISHFIELMAVDLRSAESYASNSIPADNLPDRIKYHFPSLPEIFIDFFEYCIRTCSFLSRDAAGNYSFVHDSVQAFFAAKQIYKEICQFTYNWDKSTERGQPHIEPIPYSLGKDIVDEYLMEFLSDMITVADERRLKQFINEQRFITSVEKNPNTLFYLCGNTLSLLASFYKKKQIARGIPKNLHGRNISGANLSGANLQGVNLSKCIMENVNLRFANLQNADMTGVKLINADLNGADLKGAKINGGAVIHLKSDANGRDITSPPDDFLKVISESKKGVPDRKYERAKIDDLTDMVEIPGGKFLMGTSAEFADPRERPQHEVFVSPFWLDIHPVTNAQFAEFVRANPQWGKDATIDRLKNVYYLKFWNGNDPPDGKYDFPVVYVSWYAAEAYAKWAGLRLPTEAEWEFALRDGNHDKAWNYPWGAEPSNIPPEYERAVMEGQITSVMSSTPSPNYGLYEMSGNVNEWVHDWLGENYFQECKRKAESGQPVKNPKGPPFGHQKVLRGGSFLDDPVPNYTNFACFYRAFVFPQNTNQDGGFRCAKNIDR